MPHAVLADRAVLAVTGEDAETFLQNLVTSDVDALDAGEVRPSALLTPQGKILFDFLLGRTGNGFRIDVAAEARGDLAKRLTLYKLRAKVSIAPENVPIVAVWDETDAPPDALPDRRFPDATVYRLYGLAPAGLEAAPPERFVALRIANGVAEAERDFPASDVFPHDVLLDQNGGVSFRKGCYVGQEVVSRMQHRGTARRRLMLAATDNGHLTPGSDIRAGGKSIGTVLSATDARGLALIRIDRLAAATNAGVAIETDGVPIDLSVPPWAGYALPAAGADEVGPE